MASGPSNLITLSITPCNGSAIQNVSIGLINCQSICNKYDEMFLRIWIWWSCPYRDFAYWLCFWPEYLWRGNSSWIFIPSCSSDSQERCGSRYSPLRFFEGVAIIYWLHPTKKNGLKDIVISVCGSGSVCVFIMKCQKGQKISS